jgi:ABC-2 type transport system ATP-binding protein
VVDAISVSGLVKTFGRTRALDGLDLTVAQGEVHGFLGPNGSGKSTTIRVLLGLIKASSGTARLLGGDPWTQATDLHRRLAYVPGDVTLWPNLTGGEIVDLLGRLRGGLDPARRARLVEQFELDLTKKGRAYSKGNRQKVALVAAFAADAELLILDEPTSGLDPLMETVFQQCVHEAKDRGATVLLSSHILSEVEALGDRVSIIRKGRTVDSGSLSELRHLSRSALDATVVGDAPPLADIPGVHDLTVDGKRVRCHVDQSALTEVTARLTAAELRSLTCQPPTLEELFLRHYGEQPGAHPNVERASA